METISAIARVKTEVGMIELIADDQHLTTLRILTDSKDSVSARDHPILTQAIEQIDEWFAGERQLFDLPLAPLASERGNHLRTGIAAIPYGQTLTYGALAVKLGSHPRAVGGACMRNPFPLIIPCHRVISTSGPEHYSGGDGARTKAWLIGFERGDRVGYGDGFPTQYTLL